MTKPKPTVEDLDKIPDLLLETGKAVEATITDAHLTGIYIPELVTLVKQTSTVAKVAAKQASELRKRGLH
jgi:hypothetical protein